MNPERDNRVVSWLVLERYALGELDEAEAARVARALHDDEPSQACLAMIRGHARALPPLPASRETDGWRARARRLRRWRIGGGMLALGAAAACLILVLRGTPDRPGGFPDRRGGIKGGEIVLDLVRERNGAITHAPDAFAPGDRFKVIVTCPAGQRLRGQVVIYQDGEASFPLAPIDQACGNRVAIPGAFRLTGRQPAMVCVTHDEQRAPDRSALAGGLGPRDAVCMPLRVE